MAPVGQHHPAGGARCRCAGLLGGAAARTAPTTALRLRAGGCRRRSRSAGRRQPAAGEREAGEQRDGRDGNRSVDEPVPHGLSQHNGTIWGKKITPWRQAGPTAGGAVEKAVEKASGGCLVAWIGERQAVLGQPAGGQGTAQAARRLDRRGPAVAERGRLALPLQQPVDESAGVVPRHVAVDVGLERRLVDARLATLEDVLEVLAQEAPTEEVVLFAV